jgi:Tfp pilus assembly protein PilN
MFWERWIPKKYLVKSEICGVEVVFSEEGLSYNTTYLKNGKKLELISALSSKDKPGFSKAVEKNKIPLVIVINGKGVILKKAALFGTESGGFEEVIRENLPTINQDEFYIQLFRQGDSHVFITLCRKEQVNSVVDELKRQKKDIAAVLIGSPAVIGLQPLWSSFNNVQTSTHQVELTNELADAFTLRPSVNESVKIDGISIGAEYVLGFSAGLCYLMQRRIAETNNAELLSIGRLHTEKNKFRFLMILVVVIAFTVAVTNVLFYTSYFDKNNKLETELSVYQGKYEQINQLLSDYQKKKDLIEGAGVLNRNKLSEYADKIAKTIPGEVALTEMYFNPKDENEESEDSLVKFKNKELVIKGNCNKSLIINEWVNVLKMQKFIKDVSLEKFSYNNEGLLPNYEIRLITE